MKSKLFGAAFAAVIAALCPLHTATYASPYFATMEQVGPDVVATGSGNIDLTGLTFLFPTGGLPALIVPNEPAFRIGLGLFSQHDLYEGTGTITGPTSFGPGSTTKFPDSSSGSLVGLQDNSPHIPGLVI